MKKLKGVRPLDEINQDYSITCAQLGNLSFRVTDLNKEIALITKRLQEIDLEAAECRKQTEEMAAEAPPTDKNGVVYEECSTEECKAAEATTEVSA